MFWLVLLLFVATTVLGELLKPKNQKPTAGALGDFSFPTAQEGRAIPYVLGEVLIGGGNSVWWGDLKTKPLTKRASFLSLTSTLIGYKYFIGVQYALCWGGPELILIGINANKKALPYTSSVVLNGNGTEDRLLLNVTGDNLFGGTGVGGEGGVSGKLDFYRGLTTQQPNDYLSAKQGRVAIDQSTGLGYLYSGHGNGTLSFLSGGASALNETITITATGFVTDVLSAFYHKEIFSVDGSLSGHIGTAHADFAFSSSRINFTVETGSIPFANGDAYSVKLQHSHAAPAYKRLCYAVMEQMYVGISSYPKPFQFHVRRCPDPFGQGPSVAVINGGDGNGILGIYELMTDIFFGLRTPPEKIDAASFMAAAVTVAAEGLGLSFQQDSFESADSIIGEILRHLDGVIYTDPATGLWTVKLARADYDPATLPLLDVSSIESIDYGRGSWGETTNHVIVKYISRAANFNDRTVQAYDPANVNISGEVRSAWIDFKFISNRMAASLIAMRALKTLTYPIGKLKIVANRKAWNYRMGGVFKWNWVPLGIIGMVFRITHIGYGEISSGKITIDAVEDIFGINNVAFVSPPESGWVNPVGIPVADLYEKLWEVPYHISVAEGLDGGAVMAFAVQDTAVFAKDFAIWRDSGTGYADTSVEGSFCATGFLTDDYEQMTPAIDPVGFSLTQGIADLNLEFLESVTEPDVANGLNLLLIDDEIMSWQTRTVNPDGTYTISGIMRAVMDTVPSKHLAGAQVWFFSEGVGIAYNGGATGITLTEKFLPENSYGMLPIGSATPRVLTTVGRSGLPYPPGNLRMQGQAYGIRYRTIVGDLVLNWSARNINTEGGHLPLIPQDFGDIPLPTFPPTAYEVFESINGTSVGPGTVTSTISTLTITAESRAAIGSLVGPNDAPLTVEVFTWNTGPVYCLFPQTLETIFTGFGMCFGEYFGGIQQ